jgi:hypothetical protein
MAKATHTAINARPIINRHRSACTKSALSNWDTSDRSRSSQSRQATFLPLLSCALFFSCLEGAVHVAKGIDRCCVPAVYGESARSML